MLLNIVKERGKKEYNLLVLKNPKMLESWPWPSLPYPPIPQLKVSPPSDKNRNKNKEYTKDTQYEIQSHACCEELNENQTTNRVKLRR